MFGFKKFAGAAALAALTLTGAATAASAGDYNGDFQIKAGISGVLPNTEFDGISINGAPLLGGDIGDVDNSWVPSLTLAYFVNKNVAVELFCCFAQHGAEAKGALETFLNGAGGNTELGETTIFPPILSLQYHLDPINGFKPYVGVGVQYIHFFNEEPELGIPGLGAATSFDVESAWGLSLQAGLDYEIGNGFYIGADVRYTFLDTEASLTFANGTTLNTDFDLDPLIVSAHVGYRFNLFKSAAVEPLK